jgi:hypothetical protein
VKAVTPSAVLTKVVMHWGVCPGVSISRIEGENSNRSAERMATGVILVDSPKIMDTSVGKQSRVQGVIRAVMREYDIAHPRRIYPKVFKRIENCMLAWDQTRIDNDVRVTVTHISHSRCNREGRRVSIHIALEQHIYFSQTRSRPVIMETISAVLHPLTLGLVHGLHLLPQNCQRFSQF